MSKQILPNGMNIEWTDLSFQQATQGNTALIVFPVAVLLAFLVLAALYESWTLPLAVILIVPMTMLSALFGVWLTGGDNNVFVQVGLVVLMGLACKNAILIVEFARELEIQGKGIMEAALEACRLRLRPIVMTSIAFIAGTIPLILGHGAGAEVRGVTGITVFSGMLGVTLFGLFLTPVFYVTLRKLVTRGKPVRRICPPSLQQITKNRLHCEGGFFVRKINALFIAGDKFRHRIAPAGIGFLTSSSALATVWRASTCSEACSASSAIDLKYQQALALTTQRAGTSGRDAHSFYLR
jgi:hypothetical protein